MRPLGLHATTITPTREEDHRNKIGVTEILPWQMVDIHKHALRKTSIHIHVRSQQETGSYGNDTKTGDTKR